MHLQFQSGQITHIDHKDGTFESWTWILRLQPNHFIVIWGLFVLDTMSSSLRFWVSVFERCAHLLVRTHICFWTFLFCIELFQTLVVISARGHMKTRAQRKRSWWSAAPSGPSSKSSIQSGCCIFCSFTRKRRMCYSDYQNAEGWYRMPYFYKVKGDCWHLVHREDICTQSRRNTPEGHK